MHSRPSSEREARDRHGFGALIRLAAAFGFAVMAAITKVASHHGVGPLEIALFRCIFAVPPILLWVAAGPGFASVRTRRPQAHALRSAIGYSNLFAAFAAITLLPLADAVTISFAAPLFATMLSALVLRERVGAHRWAAVALGLLGVLVVMRPGGEALPAFGLAVATAGAIGTSLVTITMRQIAATERPSAIVFWFTMSTALASALLLPFFGHRHDATQWALLAAIGVSGGLTQIGLTTALRYAPVSVIAPMDYSQLIWASLFGWLLWQSAPSATTLAGGALIGGSGLYTLWRERRRKIVIAAETEPVI